MKRLIAPIAIIICMIAFFVITGCQEFSRHDDQTLQSESPTSNRKPLVSVPETKPVTGSMPVEIKTVETKPAKTNHLAQTKTEEKKRKKEPFFQFYENVNLDSIAFEGTILSVSAIPDPEKNDYQNCLYTLLVEIDSLLSTSSLSKTIERTVLLNTPIMKNKKIIGRNILKPGDKVFCSCAEYGAMPQDIQEIQLSDDIQSFEHQQYYPLTINKISTFQKIGNRNFAKREITILPIQSFSRDEKAISSRHNRIQAEIDRVEEELVKHGGSFSAWKEEYKTIAEKYGNMSKEEYKGWINDSYFAAGGTETSYSTKEYIDGILPYKKYLEDNNIDLIVVRIPSKWDFAARVLASEDFQENPAWVEHYYECLKNDIEIVDPMPEMWKERFDFPLFYFYNTPEELHPFEGQSFVSAKVLSTVLSRYQYQKSPQEITLADSLFQTDQPRYFWPPGNEKFDPAKNIVFKQVVRDNKTIGNLASNSGSPFLFLSNSYFRFPQRSLGASVPGYTAYFIQAIPDWYYQDGTHNPMIRNLIAKPQLLNFRRAVIMVGHPDDWKEFPFIPKYIQDKAKRITLEKTISAFSDEVTINNYNSFLYSIDKDEAVLFTSNGIPVSQRVNQFEMKFSIPYLEGRKTCMVRVNFDRTSSITLIISRNDSIIDTCSLAPGRSQSADLFVPLLNQASDFSDVKILFQQKHYANEYAIKNIELWYY
ncbi:MAG: hypothetical protein J5944_09165 [Lentisphaeria bacterium]|nr:hypothetical protein [Lentisphaeria bacterium]